MGIKILRSYICIVEPRTMSRTPDVGFSFSARPIAARTERMLKSKGGCGRVRVQVVASNDNVCTSLD